jgi:hypothetical protein
MLVLKELHPFAEDLGLRPLGFEPKSDRFPNGIPARNGNHQRGKEDYKGFVTVQTSEQQHKALCTMCFDLKNLLPGRIRSAGSGITHAGFVYTSLKQLS